MISSLFKRITYFLDQLFSSSEIKDACVFAHEPEGRSKARELCSSKTQPERREERGREAPQV